MWRDPACFCSSISYPAAATAPSQWLTCCPLPRTVGALCMLFLPLRPRPPSSITQLMCNHFSCRSSITVTGSEKSLLTSLSTQIPFSLPFRCCIHSIHYCPCLAVSSPTPSQRSLTHTPRELVTANTCASVPNGVCLSTGHPPRHAGWRGRDRSAWRETRLTLGAMI